MFQRKVFIGMVGALGVVASLVSAVPAQANFEGWVPSEPISSMTELAELGRPTNVALTDTTLFVEVTDTDGPRVVWQDRADPTSGWATAWGGSELVGELVAAEAGVVQIDQGETDLVAWTNGTDSGSRPVPTGAELGSGGRYLATVDGTVASIQPVRSDTTVTTVPVATANRVRGGVAVAGDEVVTLRDDYTLERYSITTGELIEQRPSICPVGNVTVLEDADPRFSLVWCDRDVTVRDSEGVYEDFTVYTRSSSRTPAQLGAGTVVADFYTLRAAGVLPQYANDLYALRTGDASSEGAPIFDVDDAGTTVAMVDPGAVVQTADLAPYASPIVDEIHDDVAPVIDSLTIEAEEVEEGDVTLRPYTVSAVASDRGNTPIRPAGLGSVELRYRVAPAGTREFGEYVHVAGPTASGTGKPGTTMCWHARATDAFGNVGYWNYGASVEQCVTFGRSS